MKLFEKMEKGEVDGKEVKKRKRIVEKRSSGKEAAVTGESTDDKQVLPSLLTDTKPSETTTVETDDVVQGGVESDVIETKAEIKHCTVTDMNQGNDQSDVVDDASKDVGATDVELHSSQDISQSCLPPNESPIKCMVQISPSDTDLAEKTAHVELDADSTDAVDVNTAVEHQPKTVTIKAIEDEMIDVREEVPEIKLSDGGADDKCAEIKTVAITDEPQPVTAATFQSDVKAVDKVKKSYFTLQAKSSTGPNQRSAAKLKFGIYSRKPLGARTWVPTDKHDSDSDKETSDKSEAELETTTKLKRLSVKLNKCPEQTYNTSDEKPASKQKTPSAKPLRSSTRLLSSVSCC